MKQMSNLYNEQILIGKILNIERKSRNIRLQDLIASGKTIQYISEIENGNKKIYEPTISKLFSLIGIDFNFNQTTLDEVYVLFEEMIHVYLNHDLKKRKAYMVKLTSNPAWEFSYAYPLIQLTKFMATVLDEIDFFYDDINAKCEELITIFNNHEKSIYLLMKAIYEFYDLGRFESAKDNLKKSIQYSPEAAITGFAYNQLGNLITLDYHLSMALEYQKKGIEILKKYGYYRRSIQLELMVGNILAELRRFDEMKQQYLKTYDFAITYNNDDIKRKSLYNLAYYSMYGRRYEDAITYANQVIKMNYYLTECYYILAWVYMEMEDNVNFEKYYHYLEKTNKHDDYIIDHYEKCLKAKLNNKDKTYYKTLVDLYKKLNKKGYAFDQVMALEYIIEYCDQYELINEGYMYQKELLIILQKNH